MKTLLLILLSVSCPTIVLGCRTMANDCTSLETLVKNTYNFKPSKLSDSERSKKSEAMDKVWEHAKANREQTLPCLWTLLKAPNADPFFVFDGSNLLVTLDRSKEAKQFLVDAYAVAPLEDVDVGFWVSVIAHGAFEGFDVSKAALHWLSYKDGRYFLPQHGGQQINHADGALIVFGTMDEALATPALVTVASNRQHPARETAVRILMLQATPESFLALKNLDSSGLSTSTSSQLRKLLSQIDILSARAKPKTTREEFVSAFEKAANGDLEPFYELVEKVPDGEHDVVAVLKPQDVPLVRKVRRRLIRNANPHAIEFYHSFTSILLTMVWKPELVR